MVKTLKSQSKFSRTTSIRNMAVNVIKGIIYTNFDNIASEDGSKCH